MTLEVYYARFGVLVKPFFHTAGFNYNRVYFSKEAVIEDFALHGWELKKREPLTDRRASASLNNELFTFERRIPLGS